MIEDKLRHQKALALIVCLFIGYIYIETIWKPYFFGQKVVVQTGNISAGNTPAGSVNDLVAQATPSSAASSFVSSETKTNPIETKGAAPLDQQLKNAGIIRILTKDLKVELSLLGGRITKAELLKYKRDLRKKTPLNLIDHIEGTGYPLGVLANSTDDIWVQYQVLSPTALRQDEPGITSLDLRESEETTVFLKGILPNGTALKKKITFNSKGYLIDVNIEAEGNLLLSSYWSRFVPELQDSKLDPYKSEGFVWFDGQKALRKTFKELQEQKQKIGKVNWVSLGDKYFTAALIASGDAELIRSDKVYSIGITNSSNFLSYKIFLGPKSYDLLKGFGYELQREIDFGKFGVVSAPLLSLLHFLFSIFRNYGLAIVALTILVRLALYPLNSASFKQMKAMQDLKPEMDRIKDSTKDKQQQQVAMMELYKKKGVNPLGGCLPVLLQMPIFIGLYAALSLAVELRHAHFAAWIDDLSAPEKLMVGDFGIPVMVILFVLSMMVQQWTTPTTMDPAQKKVMMVMPIVMGFMFASFPAGLTLYWLTSNLISIGQQKAMHSDSVKSPLVITVTVSVAVFMIAFIATLF